MHTVAASFPVLTVMAVLPLAGALLLALVPPLRRCARALGLLTCLAVLGAGVWATYHFDPSAGSSLQLAETRPWIPALGVSWALGINGLGLAMLLLTAFLTPIVLLASWGEVPADRQDRFTGLVLVLESMRMTMFYKKDQNKKLRHFHPISKDKLDGFSRLTS